MSQERWRRVPESTPILILPYLGLSGTSYSIDEKMFQEKLRKIWLKWISCACLSWHTDCVLSLSAHLKSHSAPFYDPPSSTGRPRCLEPSFLQMSWKIPGFRAKASFALQTQGLWSLHKTLCGMGCHGLCVGCWLYTHLQQCGDVPPARDTPGPWNWVPTSWENHEKSFDSLIQQ